MTLCFDAKRLSGILDHDLALAAMEECFATEARGATSLPHRIDTDSGRGFLRVMPAIFDDVMGLKVMTLVEGLGTRYVALLFAVENGELLAVFDAEEITRERTAAVTALAGRLMCAQPPAAIGLIGSGFEAAGHLRMLAHMWPLERVQVYSPNAERRSRFAEAMSTELDIDVRPAASSAEATRNQPCIVLATKSKAPVIDGDAIDPGTVVLSIGSTRLDLRELDDRALARAAVVVADHEDAVVSESADIAENLAAGTIGREQLLSLARLQAGTILPSARAGRDLFIFKSVGTALQDLALARTIYRDPAARAQGIEIGEIAELKPFSAKAFARTSLPA